MVSLPSLGSSGSSVVGSSVDGSSVEGSPVDGSRMFRGLWEVFNISFVF